MEGENLMISTKTEKGEMRRTFVFTDGGMTMVGVIHYSEAGIFVIFILFFRICMQWLRMSGVRGFLKGLEIENT